MTTNSWNGWTASVVAADLERTVGPALGLCQAPLKAEWATSHGTRTLLGRFNLTWRGAPVWESAAEAALLTAQPSVRPSLSFAALRNTSSYLGGTSWRDVTPAPFDLCWRLGPGRFGRPTGGSTIEFDMASLGAWCRILAFNGPLTPTLAAAYAAAAGGPPAEVSEVANFRSRQKSLITSGSAGHSQKSHGKRFQCV